VKNKNILVAYSPEFWEKNSPIFVWGGEGIGKKNIGLKHTPPPFPFQLEIYFLSK
jgi:hypothetical protein